MGFLYQSTRGLASELDFRGVTLAGLASDGGLYIPKHWPRFSPESIRAMRGLPYQEIAARVLQPFVWPTLNETALRELIAKAYAGFTDPAITPLKPLDGPIWLLELFHGPTLAFKDMALQLLGHLFEHFLEQSGERITVIGATSGDTGSAALSALANRKNIDAVILYPHGRPSAIQRKQMTCIDAPNTHVLAVKGSFDDCQAIVKALFNDKDYRKRYNLAAINSINWARILAQIVYYFVAAVQLGAPDREVSFVVPTGNFGDVYAGYAARRCGLPIAKLGVASNSNDILTRFFASGHMKVAEVAATLSPSMDIQVSSNFERLLFDLLDGDAAAVSVKMDQLRIQGAFGVTAEQLAAARKIFAAAKLDDVATREVIRRVYDKTGTILDPHTAVGFGAAEILNKELKSPIVTLATAHPAKFPEAIQGAINHTSPVPETVAALLRKPERETIIEGEIQAVKDTLSSRIRRHDDPDHHLAERVEGRD